MTDADTISDLRLADVPIFPLASDDAADGIEAAADADSIATFFARCSNEYI